MLYHVRKDLEEKSYTTKRSLKIFKYSRKPVSLDSLQKMSQLTAKVNQFLQVIFISLWCPW